MIRTLCSAVSAFLIFLIFHFSYFHFFTPYEKTSSILYTALLGLLCMGCFLYILPTESWFQQKLALNDARMRRWIYPAIGVLFYGFLFLGYLEFYFTADRSITFRMLMIIDKQSDHAIQQEKMFQLYDVPNILNKRFDDLRYGGYLTLRKNNTYQLTTKGHIVLDIYRFAIHFLRLDSGEKQSLNTEPKVTVRSMANRKEQ